MGGGLRQEQTQQGAAIVLSTLVPAAQKIFRKLAEHQLDENEDEGGFEGSQLSATITDQMILCLKHRQGAWTRCDGHVIISFQANLPEGGVQCASYCREEAMPAPGRCSRTFGLPVSMSSSLSRP